jgi:DNA polymerase-4
VRARSIIHLNVADFAVAVERTLDSRLRERPVIIAPEGAARSVVYDMSEEAYASGVRKGMALPRARRCCRDATVIAPHPDRYERATRAFLSCALPFSPRIEATDAQGHLFVDATGTERLCGPAQDVAGRIRQAAVAALGVNPIWTVAPNKLVAKVASRVVKPTGECLVAAGDEETFLSPLPVQLLPGLEPTDLQHLREFRLRSIGDVARWSVAQLGTVFATRAQLLYESARGCDPSPVLSVGELPPKVLVDHEFGEDTNDLVQVHAALYALVEHAGRALRERRLAAQRVGVVLDYSDGGRLARPATGAPTSNDFVLFALAQSALERAWVRRVRLRHMQLVCDRLTFPPAQLDLFTPDNPRVQRQEQLVAALDRIRARFGTRAIQMGRSLAIENR